MQGGDAQSGHQVVLRDSYPSGLLDITLRCNLRCRHCFVFREPRRVAVDRLDSQTLLRRVRELQARYGWRNMIWLGGEPLLRRDVLEEGVTYFERNIMATNGMVPIPRLTKTRLVVSLDGPRAVNDEIRGRGSYDRAVKHAEAATAHTPGLHYLCIVCRANAEHLEQMILDLRPGKVRGILFRFYVPSLNDQTGLAWDTNEERDPVVEQVAALCRKYPDFVLNKEEDLEGLLSHRIPAVVDDCSLPRTTLALNGNFEPMFCCYGDNVDCHRCGVYRPFQEPRGASL